MGLDRSPEQLLKIGLAALKQKDYGRAIATFEQLHRTKDISTSHRLKAQMGLIRIYEAQGDHTQAQDLCKPLLNNRSQAIRQWAHEKFQQLAAGSSSAEQSVSTTGNTTQTSGFVSSNSGFVPFNADSPKVTDPPIDNATDEPTDRQIGPSLFHYQTLNKTRSIDAEDLSINKSLIDQSSIDKSSVDHSPPKPQPLKSDSPPQRATQIPIQQKSPKETSPLAKWPETWPQGSRLNTLKSLGKVSMGRLWLVQLVTIPIVLLIVRWLVKTVLTITRNYLQFIDRILPINVRLADFFWGSQTWTVIIGLGLLTLVAPWLWQWLLRPTALTNQQIQTHSPEAAQLLRRLCTKRRWPSPKIQLLASDLPLIFSYGWQPRYGQLVVSQGLLDRLEADELAAIIMYEMSHWSNLDWAFFSTLGLLLQGVHRGYWFLARWGQDRPMLLKITAGALATLTYGIFWLLTQASCGLARTRIPYRDRNTAELTGNPNGLMRALAKLSTAMTHAIDKQGYTPPLLESLNLMLPVGPDNNSSIQHLAWGAFNPLRHWLSLNQSHPPLGDRLYILSAYGRHWRLKSSLNFAHLRLNGARSLSPSDWQALLSQGGAWFGLFFGLGVAMTMWLVGAIATSLDSPLLAWLYKDRSILISMPLIGAATGHLLRINAFFPEISDSLPSNEAKLAIWQTDPTLIPINSRPVKINGILTGRPALANWLGQEWRLHTSHGSIKLHYANYFGPLSNLRGLAPWLHQPIQVTGWFRRGHHIWIDIHRLHTPQNQIKPANHPIWAIVISLIPLSYGFWLVFRGG